MEREGNSGITTYGSPGHDRIFDTPEGCMVECLRPGREAFGTHRLADGQETGSTQTRRDGRVDYGGGLENRCGATHRGFESLSLRQKT